MVTNKLRFILFIILFFNYSSILISQYHGINWLLGYGNTNDSSLFGRTILNFANNSLQVFRNSGGSNFELGFENNSYSDENGNLKIFYDGFRLGSAVDFNIIENGDTLNPGKIWKQFQGGFYPISDGSLFLPPLKNDSLVLLFHLPLEFYTHIPNLYSPYIYLTIIDIFSNNGKGKVKSKNNIIFSGNISPLVFSSCRHSNGRDWWIVTKNNQSSTYYKLLVINNEFVRIDSQEIGISENDFATIGNAVFSQNGKKLARISHKDEIQIFDFDRCDGKLSNFIQIKNDSIEPSLWVNIAISPNDRYLYASTNTKIFQYDLEASDIGSSMEIVGKWDGYIYDRYFSTSFCDMQLAPDGKIYISCASGNIFLHVINDPNKKGASCNFRLRDVTLPTYIACGLGNYPNYLLGREVGTICDSLTSIIDHETRYFFEIYPNPTDGRLYLANQFRDFSEALHFTISNLSGEIVAFMELPTSKNTWEYDFSFLNPGVYFIQLYKKHRLVQSGKLLMH